MKVAIRLPAEILRRARRQVAAGRARSLSELVTTAVEEKLGRGELATILRAMDAEHGEPPDLHKAWARRLVHRRPS